MPHERYRLELPSVPRYVIVSALEALEDSDGPLAFDILVNAIDEKGDVYDALAARCSNCRRWPGLQWQCVSRSCQEERVPRAA
jgi:hypothetical protein